MHEKEFINKEKVHNKHNSVIFLQNIQKTTGKLSLKL